MIKTDKLTITTLKGRCLIENFSFVLNDGDKLAVIGEEGNGKSTLLKAIYSRELVENYCKIEGNILNNNERVGYLEQKLNQQWNECQVVEYFLKDNINAEIDYDLYNQLPFIERVLKKYNFDVNYLHNGMKIGNLSGGEKVKLQLAKLEVGNYDVYFLDEPTNDLDIDTLKLLESFIISTTKPIMFISHDEMLLVNVANRILHIEQLIKKTKPKYTLEKCSYEVYIKNRKRQIEHQTQMAYSQRREKEKKEEILRQIKQKVENALVSAKKDPSSGRIIAKKMANIKAQERKNENEEMIEIPEVEESIKLIVDKSITVPTRRKVLEMKIPKLVAGSKILAKDIDLTVVGPERVAIIGNNGCGKSTLLKQIVNKIQNSDGLKVGYFSQNYYEMLDYSNTAIDELQGINKELNPRTLLGSLKFTREEMTHKVNDLSEGQKAKLLLMKLIIDKNNVLVLDEPTRNLSPLSNPVVRQLLNEYNGTIITVSHDRMFIKEICDKIYKMDTNGLHLVPVSEILDDSVNEK